MDEHMREHLEDGALLAALDGELSGTELRRIEAHVASCPACAERRETLRFAERRVKAALAELDAPSPWVELPAALRDAASSTAVPIERGRRRRERRQGGLSGRAVGAAAGLVLLLAAGAYALPGSPVRGWIDQSVEAIAGLFVEEPSGPVDPGPSAVSVEPDEGRVRVVIHEAAAGLRVTVGLTGETRASASARRARFVVETGRIEVRDASGELRISLPRTARDASVWLAEREVVRLEAGRLERLPAAEGGPAQILVEPAG